MLKEEMNSEETPYCYNDPSSEVFNDMFASFSSDSHKMYIIDWALEVNLKERGII